MVEWDMAMEIMVASLGTLTAHGEEIIMDHLIIRDKQSSFTTEILQERG